MRTLRRLRRFSCVLLCAISCMISTTMISASQNNGPSEPPVKCPKGYVCLSLEVATLTDVKLVELDRDLKLAKAKSKRLGGVLGCGVGVGLQVEDGDTTFDATPFCGVVWGWRF